MGIVALHWTYLEMVCSNVETAIYAEEIHDVLWAEVCRRGGVREGDEDGRALVDMCIYHFAHQRGDAVLGAMIMSALALEAVINTVAKERLTRFEREALDKVDLPGKWVFVTRLAFPPGIDPGNELIGRIARLQKQRNDLVHSKPRRTECKPDEKAPPIREDRAEQAWETCVDAIAALRALDPNLSQTLYVDDFPQRAEVRRRIREAHYFERRALGLE
jgi:hypothetical protein